MKVNSISLNFAAVVLLLIYYGCAVEQESRVAQTAPLPASAGQTAPSMTMRRPNCVIVTPDPNDPHGRPKKNGGVQARPPCTLFESKTDEIYISDTKAPGNQKRLLSTGDEPNQFTTEGSCRYCYINSSGGMSCVVTPSC